MFREGGFVDSCLPWRDPSKNLDSFLEKEKSLGNCVKDKGFVTSSMVLVGDPHNITSVRRVNRLPHFIPTLLQPHPQPTTTPTLKILC